MRERTISKRARHESVPLNDRGRGKTNVFFGGFCCIYCLHSLQNFGVQLNLTSLWGSERPGPGTLPRSPVAVEGGHAEDRQLFLCLDLRSI